MMYAHRQVFIIWPFFVGCEWGEAGFVPSQVWSLIFLIIIRCTHHGPPPQNPTGRVTAKGG